MNKIEDIINILVNKCDDSLSLRGYKEYIQENLGEAIDVVKHDGCIFDLDNIIHLKEVMEISISYEMYMCIDSHYDCSLLEIGIEDKEELFSVLNDYINL